MSLSETETGVPSVAASVEIPGAALGFSGVEALVAVSVTVVQTVLRRVGHQNSPAVALPHALGLFPVGVAEESGQNMVGAE